MSRLNMLFAAALGCMLMAPTQAADTSERPRAPTIVLVHGAFADASSWNGVIPELQAEGYEVIAVANPLRTLSGDAAYVSAVVKTIAGPVVLVGHSYGGAVISNAAGGNDNVKALVFVAGFAPEAGESAAGLIGKFPGATLGGALAKPVPLPSGANDLYIKQSQFREPFAADLPASAVKLAAATQRPITDAALEESSGEPAWKTLPSWSVYGSADYAIPAAALAFMAERAKVKRVQVIKGASHVVMLSHPAEVAKMIREAAAATTSASAS
ncbi:MAG TPA: alpha/beta hydrolase [Steroidobacteraceae bacterium]|nr:alpha/beta hydrolase [Steroidobacteraceae bacterium]